VKKFLLKLKRKLFFEDEMLTRQLFRDDDVGDIPNIHQLVSVMRNQGIKYIRRDPETNRIILKTKEGTYLATNKYFWILIEVFGRGLYDVDDKYLDKPFIVFDLGMNRAYASLFFAQHPNCQKIFGYEPDPEVFKFAKYNIELNRHLKSKIEPFNHGWGKDEALLNFYKVSGSDGIGCLDPSQNREHVKENACNKILVPIKKASDDFCSILNNSKIFEEEVRIILKIDVEGAEYDIFKDLCEAGMISKIDLIIGDCHDGFNEQMERLKITHNLLHLTRGNLVHGFHFEKKGIW
jgi:FkbM family methyltransferase